MRIKIDPDQPEPGLLARAAQILREGGLVVFPTDTLYGLGADPFNSQAVARAAQIKGRDAADPFPLLAADEKQARGLCADWPSAAQRLARRFWPGALTLVLSADLSGGCAGIDPRLLNQRGCIALRVPANAAARGLIKLLGRPLVGTSANLSGNAGALDPQLIERELGAGVELILDAGVLPSNPGSSVVALCNPSPKILRNGAIDPSLITDALREIQDGAI
ncbi:MAG: L-threonylcarbamoyladenylate synthase [Candidatus Alcyoniella australis]|nr:L-threonylcarbamoyladenylate synthase [Candidatus Alcyoniella australis]